MILKPVQIFLIIFLVMQRMKTNRKSKHEKLIIACQQSNYNQIKQLLAAGADPNSRDHYGSCINHCNDYDILKLLLEKGADPNSKDCNRETPILHTTSYKKIKLLLDHGAKYDAVDMMGGRTVFANCLYRSKYNCCKLLIERGYNVNKHIPNEKYTGTYLFEVLYLLQSPWSRENRLSNKIDLKKQIKIAKLLLSHMNEDIINAHPHSIGKWTTGSVGNISNKFMEEIKPEYLTMILPGIAVTGEDPDYILY